MVTDLMGVRGFSTGTVGGDSVGFTMFYTSRELTHMPDRLLLLEKDIRNTEREQTTVVVLGWNLGRCVDIVAY